MKYLLDLDVGPGDRATLDEFAEERFDVWEYSRARAGEVEQILRRRYPGSRCRVYGIPVPVRPPVGSPEHRAMIDRHRQRARLALRGGQSEKGN